MLKNIEKLLLCLAEICDYHTLTSIHDRPEIENKFDKNFDPVTEIDRKVEKFIRREILSQYPDAGIIGEEYGTQNEDAELVFIIDPIDGTRNFITGLLGWTSLIGVMLNGKPYAGIIIHPMTGQRFIGCGGKGYKLWADGRAPSTYITALSSKMGVDTRNNSSSISQPQVPLLTSNTTKLSEAFLHISTFETFKTLNQMDIAEKLMVEAKLTRLHYDAYGYAMLCEGKIDVCVDHGLQLYDIAALIPIIEAAGGYVDFWHSDEKDESLYSIIAAGSKELGQEVKAYFE